MKEGALSWERNGLGNNGEVSAVDDELWCSLRRSMDGMVGRSAGYGRIGVDGSYEAPAAAGPSFSFRVPRKLRILKLRSSSRGAGGGKPSLTFLGRVREAYERMMMKAVAKGHVLPVAKASRAPPALAAAVNTWTVSSSFGSRKGTKMANLDPGFKMTAMEKKYLEHLKRCASTR